jgi:ribosomal protein S13
MILLLKTFLKFKIQKEVIFGFQSIYGIGLRRAKDIIRSITGRDQIPFYMINKNHLFIINTIGLYFK